MPTPKVTAVEAPAGAYVAAPVLAEAVPVREAEPAPFEVVVEEPVRETLEVTVIDEPDPEDAVVVEVTPDAE